MILSLREHPEKLERFYRQLLHPDSSSSDSVITPGARPPASTAKSFPRGVTPRDS